MLRVEEATPSPPEPRRSGPRWHASWRLDATVLAIVSILIRIPALLATRSLVFDDGVFASSVLAMRAGEAPFRDVFSSQGPVFLPLMWLGDLIGLRTLDAPRVVPVAAGVLVTIAVYSCARRLTTRGNALLAAGLVTTSGSVLWVTAPANADGPSLALSVLALAFALRYRDDPRLRNAVWVGLAAGAAVSVKALSVPAVVIAGLVVLLTHRRVRDAVTAAGLAVAVYLVTALPWGVSRVWAQSYTYHANSPRSNTYSGALHKIVNTLWDRDILVVVALALAGVAFLVRYFTRERAPVRAETRAATVDPANADVDLRYAVAGIVLWVAMLVALMVWEPGLWRAHVAHLIPPLALLAALRPPSWKVLLVAAVITVPFAVTQNRSILWPSGYTGNEAALVHRIRELPDNALVISDDPGFVWRAGHRTPGELVDTSFQRIDLGQITERSLAEAASARDVCGLVTSSGDHFLRFKGLPQRLAAEGYQPEHFGPKITLYVRPDCTA